MTIQPRIPILKLGIILLALVTGVTLCHAERRGGPNGGHSIQTDDYWHFHNVGQLGLTITNYGILGQGYNNANQPSCQYRLRSSILQDQVEHFSYAGIWIGGKKQGQVYCSTAIMDGVFGYEDGGWEFTSSASSSIAYNPIFVHLAKIDRRFDLSRAESDQTVTFNNSLTGEIVNGRIQFGSADWDTIVTRSTVRDASGGNPYARFYDTDAVSHQDLICAYTDTNVTVPGQGVPIPNHRPLGVHVYQECYAWDFPFADAFSILSYTVTNIPTGWEFAENDTTVIYPTSTGGDAVNYSAGDTIWHGQVIEDPYFGFWFDSSIGNMNYTSIYNNSGGPGGRWNWYDNLNGYDDSRHLAFSYDYDGDAGWAQSYLGLRLLGSDQETDDWNAHYNMWTWQGSSFPTEFPMPQNEEERYNVMTRHLPYTSIPTDVAHQQSWMLLLAGGPMKNLAPGQRFTVSYAILGGKWNGAGTDTEVRRENLNRNADWAQIAYWGEDRNGNGVLDPGEDLNGDNEITRYILPGAPPPPKMAVVAGDREVTLYWDNTPEFTQDPITGQFDFEGYRVYGSPKTAGSTEEWTLLADFDADFPVDTTGTDTTLLGYNTGFSQITLDPPAVINGVNYQYRWVNEGVKNGWPRELYYTVTSYDRGNPANNLPSLESSLNTNRTLVFPGSPATSEDDDRIGVYPNPYRAHAAWDGLSDRDRLIWFRNLPPRCEVTIFTLAGERIDRFVHDSGTYTGQDVNRIATGSAPGERRVFAGGEHAWDLLTDDDQEIATGLYIYTVKDLRNDKVRTGKFLVLK